MGKKAIVNGRVIDGTGRAPIESGVVIVDEALVSSVGPAGETIVPADADRIDAAGKTVMPCLIDGHIREPAGHRQTPPLPGLGHGHGRPRRRLPGERVPTRRDRRGTRGPLRSPPGRHHGQRHGRPRARTRSGRALGGAQGRARDDRGRSGLHQDRGLRRVPVGARTPGGGGLHPRGTEGPGRGGPRQGQARGRSRARSARTEPRDRGRLRHHPPRCPDR